MKLPATVMLLDPQFSLEPKSKNEQRGQRESKKLKPNSKERDGKKKGKSSEQ